MSSPGPIVGLRVGRYLITNQIGAGGMGVVYRAVDSTLRRELALKFVSPGTAGDPKARSRLIREARLASALNHPHICTVYDIGEFEEQVYVAFEFIPGTRLSTSIPGRGLPPKTVLRYGIQIADAMAHAHAHNILHRDLKSSNVVITPERQVKVLDFGLAQHGVSQGGNHSSSASTQSTMWAGTLQYAAPEVLHGEAARPATDIWALGVVLYEMCAGHLPFGGTMSADIISAILRDSPAPLPANISPALSRVIERCLEKDPEARFKSAAEVRAALEAIDIADSGERNTIPAPSPTIARFSGWLGLAVLALALVAALTLSRWRNQHNHVTGSIESVAVLPLANLSGDRGQEYLVEGMTDILITDLAKIKALKRVISRNSVVQYASTAKSLRQIASELNVDALVTGSVSREGNRVRITAQLIDPETDRHIWADEYEGDMQDVIAFEGTAALHIAEQIKITVSPQEVQTISGGSNANAAAREAYLKGRFYWNKRDLPSLQKSFDYFQEAVRTDPNYAAGYAGLADYYLVLTNFGIYKFDEAQKAAQRALQLDPNLAEAHASLGLSIFYKQKDWKQAEGEFQSAIRLNPNYASAYQYYAIFLAFAGRIPEALNAAQRARELDPLSLAINSYVGHVLYLSRDYPGAEQQLRKTIDMDPNFAIAHYFLAITLVQQHSFEQAIAHARKAQSLWPGNADMNAILAYTYAAAGKRQEANDIERTISGNARTYTADLALADLALHDESRALAQLTAGLDQGKLWWISLPSDPALDPLRENKRFVGVLRRAGL